MKVSEDIKKAELGEEFRVCPACNYELGIPQLFSEIGGRLQNYPHLPELRGEV